SNHQNHIHNIRIESRLGYGVKLDHANNNELTNMTITGNKYLPIIERQHGINLWKSDDNKISQTNIRDVLDGVYIENSVGNKLIQNKVTDSRYGYHLMFTKQTEILENISTKNI